MAALLDDLSTLEDGEESAEKSESGVRSRVELPRFPELYSEHFDLVWRALRSLGVPEHHVEDALQEVFIVVHRRLGDFEARASFKTWLYGIVLGVSRNARRTEHRKGGATPLVLEPEIADAAPGPHEGAVAAEALRQVSEALEELSESRREVFVLAELEEMSAPEIAKTLGVNVNTVYSRLRAARIAFEEAIAKRRAPEEEDAR